MQPALWKFRRWAEIINAGIINVMCAANGFGASHVRHPKPAILSGQSTR